ncbi:MAG: UDP-N-acetylmuramoyl-L-alanyl-D-glutamate--2,6-diaminopimelate ligase, partial [Parcubacteria group bacterium]|nr:UDP-N-acetylmuramoyl-L-alanyl-D-glutamate--2,6-diaminopimelate ligase [Parcubacteria group bacterium]
NKLICVLGAAAGGRDKWKPPEYGKLAWQHCDENILTKEDPYDENPDKIIDQIASGIPSSKSYRRILDRAEAIQRAIDLAEGGDVMVITGKGCEPWMMIAGGKKISWDDRKIVREALLSKKSA